MNPALSFDKHVRSVRVDGQRYPAGRLVVTADLRAFLWVVDGGRPRLAAQADGATVVRTRRNPGHVTVEFADSEPWSMDLAQGCACGSPLKRLNPLAAIAALGQPA